MFTSALKSFSSNIGSNYTLSPSPTSVSGPWKIYDAKKKGTGKPASVFVFERKSLDNNSGGFGKSSTSSLKRSTDEVVERLKKEASSLARLRHPNILELVEPVEETRSGLQFATEAVTASLAGLLQEKDEQERVGGRASRYVTDDGEGGRRRREVEIDELEIQKGLLQIGKALEFLHENAGLVHGNLTPDAVFINAKSDWKISGLGFASPPDNSEKATSVTPINLSEVLNIDPRIPRSVQLNLDYTSPDFVLDSNLNPLADMFSLGLLIIALYNSPHKSPLESNGSVSTYRRLFTSSSTVPSPSNSFLCSRPLPRDLTASLLPRLVTRRPAQRMTAREFQQNDYFDNILVSTIRFLDALPAKTPNEKAQFMRGLTKILPSFPKSVLEKKVLPALLEEMKDKDLLSLILQNVFKIIQIIPSGKRSFSEKIVPRLTEVFVGARPANGERDAAKEAGLMVLLENMKCITENCSGKEFKDGILPIIHLAIESPTHSLVDAALRTLPTILPILDFSTIKNELFPIIAAVFTRTSSLGIKVRGLEAFVILCGGSSPGSSSVPDDLSGIASTTSKKPTSSSSALDKYTMQEKIIPLIRAIKTKEPAVMVAALRVLQTVGGVADTEFLAMDILPILWQMSLGPLLNLKQFQQFIELIKQLSTRVEVEHTKKLQELSGLGDVGKAKDGEDFMSFGGVKEAFGGSGTNGGAEDDFEMLVKGKSSSNGANGVASSSGAFSPMDSGNAWGNSSRTGSQSTAKAAPATFSWSTPATTTASSSMSGSGVLKPTPQNNIQAQAQAMAPSRTITPDLSRFETLSPSSTQFSQPLQPTPASSFSTPLQPQPASSAFSQPLQPQNTSVNWGAAAKPAPNPWASGTSNGGGMNNLNQSLSSLTTNAANNTTRPTLQNTGGNYSSFSLPPPPAPSNNSIGGLGGMGSMNTLGGMNRPMQGGIAPPPGSNMGMGMGVLQPQNTLNAMNSSSAWGGMQTMQPQQNQQGQGQQKKTGLDAWESLL